MSSTVDQLVAREATRPAFDEVYEVHFDFVWCALRRLGILESSTDDAVQDVFLVVHRKLPAFEARSTLKTWLFGIVLRVARDHRRRHKRKGNKEPLTTELVDGAAGPDEHTSNNQAWRILDRLLGELDDDKREVFVLAEIEQLPVPEIAAILEINSNTAYSRVRAARQAFEQALARHHAREARTSK